MRFRPVTLPRQSDHDFRALRMFVGAPEFDKLLKRRIDMISTFGFITDVSRMAYEVEIGLQDIGHNARKFMDQNRHRKFHVAADFVIGAAQIISQFSQKGRRTFQGQIIDGLKSAGLFKLHHELRVAAEFSKCGYDVELTGIENEGCQDFIIRKGSSEFEVEAKAFEHDAGANVNLRVAENLFQELRESDLGNVNATGIPVTNIRLQGKLPRSEQARREIVKACKEAFTGPVRTRSAISFGGYVEVITEMSFRTSKEGVDLNLKAFHRKTGIIGFANHKAPRFVIHIISARRPNTRPSWSTGSRMPPDGSSRRKGPQWYGVIQSCLRRSSRYSNLARIPTEASFARSLFRRCGAARSLISSRIYSLELAIFLHATATFGTPTTERLFSTCHIAGSLKSLSCPERP